MLVRDYLHELSASDHLVYLWVDHAPDNIKEEKNIPICNLDAEEWMNEDLLEDCTNHAMRSDILRLEIVYRYGGLYVDADASK